MGIISQDLNEFGYDLFLNVTKTFSSGFTYGVSTSNERYEAEESRTLTRMVMKRLLQYLLFAKAFLSQCLLDGPFKILTDQDMICPNLSNLGYGLPFFVIL